MTALVWLRGLIVHRPARLLATMLGVGTAVALLASVGSFLSATEATMTQRAIARVPVDWQIQAQPGTAPAAVLRAVRADPAIRQALPVSFLTSPGLTTTSRGTTQTTGAAQVLGLPSGYMHSFPNEIRLLAGTLNGPVLAQQTGANLHARPGETITVARPSARAIRVRIAGVVDLPNADSLFQKVGAPPGSQLAAPPDNVLLLPASDFARLASPVIAARPELVTTQVLAAVSHALPASPTAAFDAITARAHNLESRLAGAGIVGDNLAVALDSARSDALYAQILFLFLGLPGAVIAGLLTTIIAAAGADRRRRDAALLRTRGASTPQLVRLALAETLLAGGAGAALGLGVAALIGQRMFGTASFGAGALTGVLWPVGAALAGLAIAAAAIALPAARTARALTVAGQQRSIRAQSTRSRWSGLGIDLIALTLAGLVFWQASGNGYQLVLAPEGIAQTSVNWYALLAPALGWVGLGLLTHRLATLVLAREGRTVRGVLRPLAGELSTTVAATMSRQRRRLAQAVALLALAAAFAGSTAVFDSTYQAQAEVDARLTSGADVTVTESPGVTITPAAGLVELRHIAGVADVEALQHRYAYIGADLQDLFGVRPDTIARQGRLQDAWFAGGTAAGLMSVLAHRPDAILVSQETVHDYQLRPGDRLNLRLQDGRTRRLITVPFHYEGVAKEFPTAPHDSFFIANQSYISARTGSAAVGAFLIQTDGTSPISVAHRVHRVLGTTAQISNIVTRRQITASNLTAVELSGLTRIELAFAAVLAVAASGLILGVGFRERRRTFAIAAALGATRRHLGAFVWGETLLVTAGGLAAGSAIAALLSVALIDILGGVFDPPPETAAIPWGYLAAVVGAVIAAVLAGGSLTTRMLLRGSVEALRDL